MREILFRGKDVKENWHEGLLCHKGNAWYISNSTGNPMAYEVIPSTIGQYTGLTDKNGRKIFEGDVVKDEQSQLFGKVFYATASDEYDGISGFMVDDIDDGLQNYNSFWHLVEVIGNVHDNPELLNDDKQVKDLK